jgi:hypothetical protein
VPSRDGQKIAVDNKTLIVEAQQGAPRTINKAQRRTLTAAHAAKKNLQQQRDNKRVTISTPRKGTKIEPQQQDTQEGTNNKDGQGQQSKPIKTNKRKIQKGTAMQKYKAQPTTRSAH